MLFQLKRAFSLVVICLTAMGYASPHSMPGGIPTGLPSAQVELTTVLPSEYADPSLREVDSTTVCGQRLVAVCASPNHPATSTGVPPYAKVFIVAIRGSKPEVIATAVCTGDVLSESIVALSDGKCGLVIGAVTRQYGGSVSRFHLREYRYAVKTHQLQRQLVVRYVDGATLPLPGKSGRSPAFLVAEPVYDVFKFQPQRYRFRLYAAPSSEGYSLRLTLMTNRRYDRLEGAYREIRPRLLKAVGSAYSVASLFPPLTPA